MIIFYKIASESAKRNIDALIIHARTATQRFSGKVDWDLPVEIKHDFPDTTIKGNGDNLSPMEIVNRLKKANLTTQ